MLASPEFLAHAGSEVTMHFDSFASALGALGFAAVLASWTSSWTLACLAFFLSFVGALKRPLRSSPGASPASLCPLTRLVGITTGAPTCGTMDGVGGVFGCLALSLSFPFPPASLPHASQALELMRCYVQDAFPTS